MSFRMTCSTASTIIVIKNPRRIIVEIFKIFPISFISLFYPNWVLLNLIVKSFLVAVTVSSTHEIHMPCTDEYTHTQCDRC